MDDVIIIVANVETGEYITTFEGKSEAGTDWGYIEELTSNLNNIARIKMRNQLENE